MMWLWEQGTKAWHATAGAWMLTVYEHGQGSWCAAISKPFMRSSDRIFTSREEAQRGAEAMVAECVAPFVKDGVSAELDALREELGRRQVNAVARGRQETLREVLTLVSSRLKTSRM